VGPYAWEEESNSFGKMQIVPTIMTFRTAGLPRAAGFGLVAIAVAILINSLMDLRLASGQRLPELTLQQVLNPQVGVTADSLGSRPAIVNVWASWCVACRNEHDVLMELEKTSRLPLIGLNHQDIREDALRWLSYFGDPYRFSVFDGDGAIGKALNVEVLPVTFLIGTRDEVLVRHDGPLTTDAFTRKFVPVLEATRETGK